MGLHGRGPWLPAARRLEQGATRSLRPWAGGGGWQPGQDSPRQGDLCGRAEEGLVGAQAVVCLPAKVPSKSELPS